MCKICPQTIYRPSSDNSSPFRGVQYFQEPLTVHVDSRTVRESRAWWRAFFLPRGHGERSRPRADTQPRQRKHKSGTPLQPFQGKLQSRSGDELLENFGGWSRKRDCSPKSVIMLVLKTLLYYEVTSTITGDDVVWPLDY